jgi:iron-sulfur cluster repair protein YtfE (RIC family)
MNLTETIKHEHLELLRGVESIREAGDLIGVTEDRVWKARVNEVLEFLQHQLIPHAKGEDDLLYPNVGRLMGSPDATRTMSRDHVEVMELTHQLERGMEEPDQRMIRRLLYGLYHIIRLHFAKEEEIYLPLLGSLDAERAEDLLATLEAHL